MPQISVIVPVYKVEAYLHRCVVSVLAQTFSDFELILIDDGSPDNCPAMCDEYAKQDPRVVVIHQKNSGLSAARNAGIDWAFVNSDSDWLTFIDSDDWVHLEYLERLYNAVVENNVAISVCGFERTEGDEPTIKKEALTPALWTPEDFYVEHNVNAVIACGKLYRKELFKNIRYPVGKIHEDEFTTHKLLFQCERIAVIKAPLYAYYQNPSGIMGSEALRNKATIIEACEMQLVFFIERNYIGAHNYQIEKNLNRYVEYMNALRQAGKYTAYLQMKKAVKYYCKKYRLAIKEYPWVYEAAYPTRMKLYWLWQAIKKRSGNDNICDIDT